MVTSWLQSYGSRKARVAPRSRKLTVESLEGRAMLSATPIGAEFRVNTTTHYTQGTPAIATNASGASVAVWESNQADPNHYGIYGQRLDSSGAKVGSEFLIASTTVGSTGGDYQPSVAMDSAGNFVVVWWGPESSFLSTAGNIYGQRYNSSGVAVGSQFTANAGATQGSQTYPSVAMSSTGSFVVVWQSLVALGSHGP
ncbi:hypothetical protein ACYOEI_33625, partial [Singulisphaera rosea]